MRDHDACSVCLEDGARHFEQPLNRSVSTCAVRLSCEIAVANCDPRSAVECLEQDQLSLFPA